MSISCFSSSPTPPPLENKQTKQKEKSGSKMSSTFCLYLLLLYSLTKGPHKRAQLWGKTKWRRENGKRVGRRGPTLPLLIRLKHTFPLCPPPREKRHPKTYLPLFGPTPPARKKKKLKKRWNFLTLSTFFFKSRVFTMVPMWASLGAGSPKATHPTIPNRTELGRVIIRTNL